MMAVSAKALQQGCRVKISELAKRTGVPKETIHYYLRSGVLRRPHKKGKNWAEYHEGYVAQIQIIKRLQDDYFLPLSVIKKVLKRQARQSPLERSASELLYDYFKPLELLLKGEVVGREAFREATGLSQRWLAQMEQWGVITPHFEAGEPVYSRDDVIIGRLLVDMDRLGFGPKDGHDPENIKRITDFLRSYVKSSQEEYYRANLERLISPQGPTDKEIKIIELMSLFFYHLYRKLVREGFAQLRRSMLQKGVAVEEKKGVG